MLPEFKTVQMLEGCTATSAEEVYGIVDTLGFDYCVIDICEGTANALAATAAVSMRIGESETAPTDVTTDCTAIVALTGAAATSTSAGFVLPPGSSTVGSIYRFNINLQGRMRYLAVDYAPEEQMVGLNINAHLFRMNDGEVAMETQITSVAGCRLIVSA